MRDSFDALLQQRIVFLRGPIDGRAADAAIAQLLHLNALDPTREISLYVNSPSADLRAALALYDMIHHIEAPIRTVCLATAAGGATLIVAGAPRGKREALPNARISLHSPRREISATAGEIDVQARELLRLRQQVHELMARHTGQSLERIERDAERETWLSADEARAYGIIDRTVSAPKAAGQDEESPSS